MRLVLPRMVPSWPCVGTYAVMLLITTKLTTNEYTCIDAVTIIIHDVCRHLLHMYIIITYMYVVYSKNSLCVPPPPPRSGAPQFRSSPHIVAYNPAESAVLVCSNTTNAENAHYEIFPVPRNTDPSNPECESCTCTIP